MSSPKVRALQLQLRAVCEELEESAKQEEEARTLLLHHLAQKGYDVPPQGGTLLDLVRQVVSDA